MNAGAEPPDFRPVPPELTMGERLRLNGYQKEEREKQRQQAIDHNNAQRELLTRQAADGRKLHPSLIASRPRATGQQSSRPRTPPKPLPGPKTGRRGREKGRGKGRAGPGSGQAPGRQKAELERLDRTIEQRRGHGRDGPSFGPR